ncbi:guanylate-binding protein 6-like [Macrotis lagotis]|uniref:guanylate-binding protein 6-like n=1 Tax=Macrotis lagotis TaxID=92651 RepID=UPI003D68AA08
MQLRNGSGSSSDGDSDSSSGGGSDCSSSGGNGSIGGGCGSGNGSGGSHEWQKGGGGIRKRKKAARLPNQLYLLCLDANDYGQCKKGLSLIKELLGVHKFRGQNSIQETQIDTVNQKLQCGVWGMGGMDRNHLKLIQVTMASTICMIFPICLVENRNEKLTVNRQALQILTSISKPVLVVAIVGPCRTGKSYLMNRLAGKNRGFDLDPREGIWMWCINHPRKDDHVLVLLDTEGIGDEEKDNSKNHSWIFALAILLSSTLIYNSKDIINHQTLEQMHYITDLPKLIKFKSSPNALGEEDSAEFVGFFPDFVWTVRDFNQDGHPINPDEYLENALKLSKQNLLDIKIRLMGNFGPYSEN